MTITKVIKALYVKLGGSLTDTISGIAGGAPVSSYSVISDCIKALYVLYGGDLTEVYPEISDVAVSNYSTTPKAIEALVEVATKGIAVNESYDISEGTLNSATITLEGDVTANIPDGVTTIGMGAFMNNTVIEKVIMPDSIETIEDGNSYGVSAFYQCSRLKNVEFSNHLTSIGDFAFSGCTSLTSITIPDSVTSIGANAFYYCTGLTDIYYTGTQAEWEQITIGTDAIPAGATIHYEYIPET